MGKKNKEATKGEEPKPTPAPPDEKKEEKEEPKINVHLQTAYSEEAKHR